MLWETFLPSRPWKIAGIKEIRRQTGLGLKEAKDLWEELEQVFLKGGESLDVLEDHLASQEGDVEKEVEEPTIDVRLVSPKGMKEQQVSILTALKNKQNVAGIKNIRWQTGHGLKEAKKLWDELVSLHEHGGEKAVLRHPRVVVASAERVEEETSRRLKMAVHAAKSQEAGEINKEGTASQLNYLRERLGLTELSQLFPELF